MQLETITPFWDKITPTEREDILRQALGQVRPC